MLDKFSYSLPAQNIYKINFFHPHPILVYNKNHSGWYEMTI